MPYDELLAARIRDLLDVEADVTERAMFGGLGFMVEGRLAVAAGSTGALMVRGDPGSCEDWVDGDRVAPMVMRNRPMRSWLLVSTDVLASPSDLATWVGRGVSYARSLPTK